MAALLREIVLDPMVPASVRAAEYGVAGLLPPHFDQWFARACDRDPAARFETARQAYNALIVTVAALGPPDSFLPRSLTVPRTSTTGAVAASVPPPPPSARPASRAKQAAVAAALVAVVAAAAIGGYALHRPAPAEDHGTQSLAALVPAPPPVAPPAAPAPTPTEAPAGVASPPALTAMAAPAVSPAVASAPPRRAPGEKRPAARPASPSASASSDSTKATPATWDKDSPLPPP
jgi:serine/threonine-protein kinase